MTQRNDKVTATVQVGGMINYTPCSVEVGEVTTLPAGSDATVTNSGNDYEVVLDFGIPQGAKGDTGDTGATGKSAYESAVEQGYEGTEEEFGTSLITIDEKAAAAASSASDAADSATAAANSATSAASSASTATTKASEAASSATSAASSATSAGSNATAAQNYVTQASTFASNAANSATNAASYASNAASSASNAASMASSASTSASTASAVLEDPDFVAVAADLTNINTVASDINRVNLVADDIASVHTVAVDISTVIDVADNKTNIDAVAASLPDIQDKQNKVLTTPVVIDGEEKTTVEQAIDTLNDEWVKSADWPDIRSGAIPNSVYFLVGHSADYSTYPTFVVQATISNSGTYDVFVDGIKQATTASGTETTLTWQTLALTSEWEVTYPASLKTHIVRVTPSTGTNTITNIRTGAISNKGILWAHFTTQNYISLEHFAQSSTSPNASDQAPVWESVTSLQDKLNISNLAYAFDGIRSVKTVPALVAQSNSTNTYATLFLTRTAVKKVKLVNIKTTGASMFRYCFNLEEAEFENCVIGGGSYQYIFQEANNLKKIPSINFKGATDLTTSFTKMPKLEPTFLDFSSNTVLKKLDCYGTSTVPSYGIKGITVSNEAPFDGGSPQLFVAYTGMDRTALVNLFNSMPYNVGYTVVGSPTIVDGVVSEFSDSNHLNLTDTFDPKKPYKIQVKFKLNSAFTNVSNDFFGVSTSGIFHLRITPSGKLDFCVGNGIYDFNVVEIEGTTILSANTDYWVQFEFTGTKYIIRLSTDGTTWTEENSLNSTAVPNPGNPFTLQIGDGHSNHWYFRGSIDLNETYININGIPWFTGKAAMTKTCNVVGCTGTADLTAEDKAIATDKGWALTLS